MLRPRVLTKNACRSGGAPVGDAHLFFIFILKNQTVIDLNLSIRCFFVRSSAMRTQAASAAGEFK
jgi:hypothetical protein